MLIDSSQIYNLHKLIFLEMLDSKSLEWSSEIEMIEEKVCDNIIFRN